MTIEEYLTSHTLTQKTLDLFGVKAEEKRLVIPVYDEDGTLQYCKYRNLTGDAKYTFDKGSHPTLFGIHLAKDKSTVVLCEGEVDAMRLWQENIPAVSSTGGANKFDKSMAAHLVGKKVLVCFDSDEAGKRGVAKVVRILKESGIQPRIIKLPPHTKDVSDFLTTESSADPQETSKHLFLGLVKKAQSAKDWLRENAPEEFQVLTDQDLVSMDFPKEKWLIENILPDEGFTFIFGSEGTGKSLLTLSLAKALAIGENWVENFYVPTPQRVLFLDKENSKRIVADRLKNMGLATGNVFYIKYPEKFSLIEGGGEYSEFALHLSEFVREEGIRVLMLDSFTDFMIGDENARGDTQAFFDSFRELFPGTCVVVLHHENKPTQGVFRKSSHRSRGSSNIGAQLTTQFRLEKITNQKRGITMENTKGRDAEELDKFALEMKVKVVGKSESGADITGVTGFEYKGMVLDDETKLLEAEKGVEELLKARSMLDRQGIIDRCKEKGISKASVVRALKGMVEKGMVDSVFDTTNRRKKNYIWIGEVVEEDE